MRYPEDFEIIFSGGPLLPPRRSKPPRWWTMGRHVAVTEPDPAEATRLREATRPKRAYTRSGRYATRQQPPLEVTCMAGEADDARVSPLPDRPVAPAGESATPGVGTGRLSTESLQTLTHHQTSTLTEPTS